MYIEIYFRSDVREQFAGVTLRYVSAHMQILFPPFLSPALSRASSFGEKDGSG